MIYFNSDYLEGAHPSIMKRLAETNMAQSVGYSEDEYCAAAREKIKAACEAPDADVHFLVGGTQTNTTVIASILRPYQGVIAPTTGHINCHETGAIESTGHKVLALPTDNGKITAQQIEEYYLWHHTSPDFEHIVMPGMVYISYPTEGGTIYSKAELTAIYETCQRCGLPLYIDGARMGYGLMSDVAGTGKPVRCFLYRRHEGRRAVRRGGGGDESRFEEGFPFLYEAARRYAGKGPPVGYSVRYIVYRRFVPEDFPSRH